MSAPEQARAEVRTAKLIAELVANCCPTPTKSVRLSRWIASTEALAA